MKLSDVPMSAVEQKVGMTLMEKKWQLKSGRLWGKDIFTRLIVRGWIHKVLSAACMATHCIFGLGCAGKATLLASHQIPSHHHQNQNFLRDDGDILVLLQSSHAWFP